ncbi:SHOCT domain-containing protein [Actinomadura latina]|uniref:PH domain-containing protein n=1 Tax=Actinomadura latina TaxID=163603 RepID=A0A846Z1W9_9ACTN|nr:SHOCT domain-containing protein [Actinomadura latina]NKZ06899.1 PH domain-containing protein [Actinomadura latina]
MTVHSGQEQIIWEGESRNVTARATGGRFTLHYRLTTHYLYFETGGISGTRQEQIPLINIQDVDVSQTLLQKTQKVGNVLVHIVRPGSPRETAVLDSIVEPAQVRDLINQTVHHVRAAVHQRQLDEQRDLGTHRFQHTGPLPQPAGGPDTGGFAQPPALPQPSNLQTTPAIQATNPDEVMRLLKQLGELRDAGVVTNEEFEAKKKDLLDRL